MKKIRLLLAAVLLTAFPLSLAADKLTESQKALRTNNIIEFLREEGFSPSINEDGNVEFKEEGELHWIHISSISSNSPFYVELIRAGYSTDEIDVAALLVAVNQVNREIPVAKAILMDESVRLVVETFCHDAEGFRYIFYESIRQLESMDEALVEYYGELDSGYSSSSEPFVVNSVEVGNVDYEGNVIYDYGSTIYSSKTKYLKPKLYLKVNKAGNYDIYVKLFNSSGTLSTGKNSPSGYSYKYTVSLSESTTTMILLGWGSDSYGHWKSGNYRFEFYCNGEMIATKYFTIY